MSVVEYGYVGLNKKGEELCGDKVECIKKDSGFTLVLADGMGSGVKANILATLTSKILSTMIANGIDTEECIDTIISSLPVCKVRGVAYSTFSILSLNNDGEGFLTEFDNPPAILLRNGKCEQLETTERMYLGKKIRLSPIKLQLNDFLLLMSDGVLHAGIGQTLNFGWDKKEIREFCELRYDKNLSAVAFASLVANACYNLYAGQPGDDTTVLGVKFRPKLHANIMVGPPVDKSRDAAVVGEFISAVGKKIVCGGTSSQVVARETGKKLTTSFDYPDKEVPPIGYIDGIDLTTEGVLTLKKLVQLAEKYLDTSSPDVKIFTGKDGGSLLANMLLVEASDVHIFVGRSVNLAHEGLNIDNRSKLDLLDKLTAILNKLKKNVEIKYY